MFTRIRVWRARRKDQKNEQAIAQAAVSAKDNAAAQGAAQENRDAPRTRFLGQSLPGKHAGEEGKKHY
jgi:hypothetical protein